MSRYWNESHRIQGFVATGLWPQNAHVTATVAVADSQAASGSQTPCRMYPIAHEIPSKPHAESEVACTVGQANGRTPTTHLPPRDGGWPSVIDRATLIRGQPTLRP